MPDTAEDSGSRTGHHSLPFSYQVNSRVAAKWNKYNRGIAYLSAVISYRESCQMDEGLL